ncbi:siderophore-interacting protein [Sphaerisporangium sp. NPDC004334]
MAVGTEETAGPEAVEVSAYRVFRVRVTRVTGLGPSFTRVTFTGDDLDLFAGHGLDQRINLLFPIPGRGYPHLSEGGDWYRRWRMLPREHRNPIRTYTAGAVRPGARELDIDFVLHGAAGPASRWACSARPGDPLVVVGPDARHRGPATGREWAPPPDATRLLIAGDETAVPAIAAIAESLPGHVHAEVILEVPDPADTRVLLVPPGVRVTWLPRGGAEAGGHGHAHGERLSAAVRAAAARLAPAAQPPAGAVAGAAGGREQGSAPAPEPQESVAALERRAAAVALERRASAAAPQEQEEDDDLWEVPDPGAAVQGGFYAWLAGEAGMVTGLRRHLVGELGVDRRTVAFMGYWRHGRPGGE